MQNIPPSRNSHIHRCKKSLAESGLPCCNTSQEKRSLGQKSLKFKHLRNIKYSNKGLLILLSKYLERKDCAGWAQGHVSLRHETFPLHARLAAGLVQSAAHAKSRSAHFFFFTVIPKGHDFTGSESEYPLPHPSILKHGRNKHFISK